MLTDKQMVKAREALRRKKTEDLCKRVQLRLYRHDQQTAAALHLPFRMIHRSEYPEGEIKPNRYYPNDGSVMIDPDTGDLMPVPETERLQDADMDYWFTRFLTLIDIDGYSDSDLTGDAITKEAAAAIREEYRRRIRDYHEHPENYNTRGYRREDLVPRRYPEPPTKKG